MHAVTCPGWQVAPLLDGTLQVHLHDACDGRGEHADVQSDAEAFLKAKCALTEILGEGGVEALLRHLDRHPMDREISEVAERLNLFR